MCNCGKNKNKNVKSHSFSPRHDVQQNIKKLSKALNMVRSNEKK